VIRTAAPLRIGELCERSYRQAEPELSPAVAAEYRHLLDRRILPRWGPTPLSDLEAAELDEWYAQLRTPGGAGERALSPNSVLRIHSVLHHALNRAVRWGWLATNPASAASPPRPRKHHVAVPDANDVARLVEAAARVNPALSVFFRLAAASGARRGELCALRWKHVDLERGRITISRGLVHAGGTIVEQGTKTHAERRVTLDPGTVATLEAHRSRQLETARLAGMTVGPNTFVFSDADDGSAPWRPGYVTLAFTRLRDDLGLDGVRLHDLRHFNATSLLTAGTDIRTVSGRLGHANASTTLNIYAHFVEHADEQAVAAIGRLLD